MKRNTLLFAIAAVAVVGIAAGILLAGNGQSGPLSGAIGPTATTLTLNVSTCSVPDARGNVELHPLRRAPRRRRHPPRRPDGRAPLGQLRQRPVHDGARDAVRHHQPERRLRASRGTSRRPGTTTRTPTSSTAPRSRATRSTPGPRRPWSGSSAEPGPRSAWPVPAIRSRSAFPDLPVPASPPVARGAGTAYRDPRRTGETRSAGPRPCRRRMPASAPDGPMIQDITPATVTALNRRILDGEGDEGSRSGYRARPRRGSRHGLPYHLHDKYREFRIHQYQ